MAYRASNGSTLSLSGGTATGLGRFFPAFEAINGTISLTGGFSAVIDNGVSAAGVVILSGPGALSIDGGAAGWRGRLTRDNFSEADWITALTDTGITVGGTQITAGNFSQFFNVFNAGAAGSFIQSTAIPEPSTGLLLGFGLFGLCGRRRRKRG